MATVKLPFDPPLEPMLSKPASAMPEGDFLYEPKWDGFRALAFRAGDDVYLQSRDGKPLARYFPELLPALRSALPDPCVVDGEIVIAKGARLDFETLRTDHPNLVMVSSSLMGQTGPLADFAGFGNLAASVTGFGRQRRVVRS